MHLSVRGGFSRIPAKNDQNNLKASGLHRLGTENSCCDLQIKHSTLRVNYKFCFRDNGEIEVKSMELKNENSSSLAIEK